jgi:hypothetical protein
VGAFVYSEILVKVDLIHTPERAKKIAQFHPQPFDGIVMNFANSLAIVISRPDALARCMANHRMFSARLGQMIVGAPFVGINGGFIPSGLQDAAPKIPSCAVSFKSTCKIRTITEQL